MQKALDPPMNADERRYGETTQPYRAGNVASRGD